MWTSARLHRLNVSGRTSVDVRPGENRDRAPARHAIDVAHDHSITPLGRRRLARRSQKPARFAEDFAYNTLGTVADRDDNSNRGSEPMSEADELNVVCCEDMCVAISGGDLRLYKDGPGLPGEEAPAVSFCPFCGAQYVPRPESEASWGWRLVRLEETEE